jgi:hypothetical protein
MGVPGVREVAKVLECLGHTIDEVDDGAMCDWSALWSGSSRYGSAQRCGSG